MYCGEPYNYTKNLFFMTYLYFSKLVHCLLTKAPLKYAIVCSMKNVTIIFWNHNVVIRLRLLSSKPLTLLKCINEMFSPPKTFATPHLCMVKGGQSKGLGDNYQMMSGIGGFWLDCPFDHCLPDCPLNDIVGILDAKIP